MRVEGDGEGEWLLLLLIGIMDKTNTSERDVVDVVAIHFFDDRELGCWLLILHHSSIAN